MRRKIKKKRFKTNILLKQFHFKRVDSTLLTITFILILTGLSFLFSASSSIAYYKTGDSFFYFKRQFLWTFTAVFIMFSLILSDLNKIRKYIPFLIFTTLILLIITLFMPKIQNVRRWIPLGFMNLQTSEIAKIAFVLYLSDYIDRYYSKINDIKYLLKPFIIISLIMILIALEPDLGTPILIFINFLIILFICGVNFKYILTPFLIAVPLVIIELIRHPYRIERMKVFLSPWSDPTGKSYQLVQSLVAAASGWWIGKGPGNSIMKLNYLPKSHTDFIFPIIAEEVGFLGVSVIIILFMVFFMRSLKIAKLSRNSFLSILTLLSATMIITQTFINMAMAIGMIPTKGLPLPFFSYGGSSIISTMILVGFILNVSANIKGRKI